MPCEQMRTSRKPPSGGFLLALDAPVRQNRRPAPKKRRFAHVVRSQPEFKNSAGFADLGLLLTLAAMGGIYERRRDRNLCKMRHFWIARVNRPLAMRFAGVARDAIGASAFAAVPVSVWCSRWRAFADSGILMRLPSEGGRRREHPSVQALCARPARERMKHEHRSARRFRQRA